MATSAQQSDVPRISRRDAIRRATLAAGVAFSPAWLTFFDRARPAAQAAYLDSVQLATARAFAERLLPRTDTPGATDVGVAEFIDRLYGEFMTEDERTTLVRGLDAVEAGGRAEHGAAFAALAGGEQDVLLRRIAAVEEAQPGGFFRLFRSAAILGYFTSEEVGRNVLHYDPIPGRYEPCVPLADVGNRNWTA